MSNATISRTQSLGQKPHASVPETRSSQILMHFAISTVSLTLARGLSFGGRAVVLLLLVSILPPPEVNYAVIAVTLADTARLVCDFGVEVWLVRAIGAARSEAGGQIEAKAGLAIRLVAAMLASVAVWFVAKWIVNLRNSLALTASILTLTGLVIGVPIAVLQARSQLPRLMFSVVPLLAVGLGVVAALTHVAANGTLALLVLAVFEAAATVASLLQSKLAPKLNFRSYSGVLIRVREFLPVASYNALVGSYMRLDVWFLAWLNPAALPTYTVAFRLYQPVALAAAAFAGVAYAAIARQISGNPDARMVLGVRLLLGVALAALGVVVGFLAATSSMVVHWFPAYLAAIAVLTPLALLLPIVGINGICVAMLAARGRFPTLCAVATFNLVIFAVALRALIPAFGASGAAAGLLIGETCSLCVLAWLVRPFIAAVKSAPN